MNTRLNRNLLFFSLLFIAFFSTTCVLSHLPCEAGQTKNKNTKATSAKKNTKKKAKAEKKEIPVDPTKNEVKGCSESKTVSVKDLVKDPERWLNQEICFTGKFSSFTNLALDYPKAMRSHNKYISLTLYRPSTEIPLGELKLAMDIETAQKHEGILKIEKGDTVNIKGNVFGMALGEPWIDIIQIKITKGKK